MEAVSEVTGLTQSELPRATARTCENLPLIRHIERSRLTLTCQDLKLAAIEDCVTQVVCFARQTEHLATYVLPLATTNVCSEVHCNVAEV